MRSSSVVRLAVFSAASVLSATIAWADPAQPESAAAPMATAQPAPTATAQPAQQPAPQQATSAQTPPAASTQASADGGDQIVCRTKPPTTGTRLGGSRVCHTQREWDQQQRDSQNALTNAQQRMLGFNPSGK
jgi:hypothetical protein